MMNPRKLLTNFFKEQSSENLTQRLKYVLVLVILINILIVSLQFLSFKSNFSAYKKNLINLGDSILQTFEGGHRTFLTFENFSKNNLRHFMTEISKQKIIKNFIIYDADENILLSLYDRNKNLTETDFKDTMIVEVNHELAILKRYDTYIQKRTNFNFFYKDENDVYDNDLYVGLFLDNTGLKQIRAKLYYDLAQFSILQLFLLLISFYTIKIINLYMASQSALRKSEKIAELGKFSAILAHEIRNPLSSIQGLIKFAQKKEENEQIKSCLDRSIDEIDHLTSIVNDFLFYGKETVLQKEKLSLRELISKTLDLVHFDAENKNLRLCVPENNIFISADKDRMLQVILNLVLNAVQAATPNSVIDLVIDENRRSLVISNHVELPTPIDIDKLFSPFYTTKSKGAGLGLAISKKIIDLHGFSITSPSTNPFTIKIDFGSV